MNGGSVFGGVFEEGEGVGADWGGGEGLIEGEWPRLPHVWGICHKGAARYLSAGGVFEFPLEGAFKGDGGAGRADGVC